MRWEIYGGGECKRSGQGSPGEEPTWRISDPIPADARHGRPRGSHARVPSVSISSKQVQFQMRFLASTHAAYVGNKALPPHRSEISVGSPVKRKPQHENMVAAHILRQDRRHGRQHPKIPYHAIQYVHAQKESLYLSNSRSLTPVITSQPCGWGHPCRIGADISAKPPHAYLSHGPLGMVPLSVATPRELDGVIRLIWMGDGGW